ncbi:MAG: biotin--[acetyl-CoA-carboxylase] ligase [Prevotellaceae bacterium]|nr:biotin--[acetyl-CoA-carboxylase] ligase [Prevotella sp.]MDD7257626.1 biotin--[acetyl-CoA-carboxylase] ligase [Prevotellaceae bacterium]MDY6131244.1 biotin--[acetyl-CoA-carboxylase] ligase [Prevotella sp.]
MNIKTLYIKEVESTNDYLWRYRPAEGEDMTVAWTDFQSAGRGCGTNRWESEKGKNLTFSLLVHPQGIPAEKQFILSMANAVALKQTLDEYVGDVRIKWPNDIYWRNKKLCGTLIESRLCGKHIKDCIIGTGINVNQQNFCGDAPNPVSICQIVGHETEREEMLQRFVRCWVAYLKKLDRGEWEEVRNIYRASLYWKGERHKFRHLDGREAVYTLEDVEDDGHLVLGKSCGAGEKMLSKYAFKEIQYVIDEQWTMPGAKNNG